MIRIEGAENAKCPACASGEIARDSAGVWLFVFAWLLPPVSWLLFTLNENRWCMACGTRFRLRR